MFKIDKAQASIDIKAKKKRASMFSIPTDRKYPETKEEFKKAMILCTQNISEEIRYMAGCIHFTSAPDLKPKSKSWWFEKLFAIAATDGPLNEIIAALGIKADDNKLEEI
jgi:hypothetical protein